MKKQVSLPSMHSCIKAQASTASCRLPIQNYARVISSSKGLWIGLIGLCITLALMIITVSTSTHPSLFKGPSTPNIRTLFLRILHVHYQDDDVDEGNLIEYENRIKQVFERASMPNRTVILTTLNGAWANEGTMLNLFLESFSNGLGTQRLLQHLIFICVDDKAYERCLVVHPHCLRIRTGSVNLSQEQILLSRNYIKLVWRRIKFLRTVLEMNFNFVFTDTDVLWFRDPFPLLQNDEQADFQVASDTYNKRAWDINNAPNTGFMYVRANKRTISFFEYWYRERARNSKLATQGIFSIIKFAKKFKRIGMNLRFLDPQFIGGFCTIKDTDMTKALTMHATCCKGLEAKLIDLNKTLEGWKKWQQLQELKTTYPQFCKSEGSYDNQDILPPCNAPNLHINPKFDEPLTCIQSLTTKTHV